MTDTSPIREALIERLQAAARTLGRDYVRRREFERFNPGTSRFDIIKFFGSYTGFVSAAGLRVAQNARLSDETLLRALRDACLAHGAIVSNLTVRRHGGCSAGAYLRRWGRWRNALVALREWVEQNDPGFPYLAALPTGTQDARPLPAGTTTRRYGAPINYRGILLEPINEAGVIMLFGALAQELGFAVERVAGAFPDCEAKRRMADGWRDARIEFEYESRNFQRHGHDPAGCDLIVCWEHNWPDCPVEVLELKAAVATAQRGQL